MRRSVRIAAFCGMLLGVMGIAGVGPGLRADDPAPPAITFEDDVLPILEARCIRCHGALEKKGGLDLRRKFTIVAGGDGGTSLEPGKPDESLLIEKVVSGEMPPKDEGQLDQKQIDVLKKWVAAGAPLKGASEAPLEAADADDSLNEAARQFWAFQPPVRVEPPMVKSPERVRTPIDALLLAKLEERGLTFNPDAEKAVLLRRACFDLTGLPPTPEELEEFLADTRTDAYERLVDRLLASPAYGERWGRHWLDLAGYADSDGYLEADRERLEAWRYRDYVIRALNADKPYDRFVLEQLAGDELTDWRRMPELTPEVADQLIATGFLRTASDPTYGVYKEKTEIYKMLADTMQIVGSAFLGVTVQCARCHAHKTDPISQRDYYQMHAVFEAAYDPDPSRWLTSSERAVPLATEAELARIQEWNQRADQRIGQLTSELGLSTARFQERLIDAQLDLSGRGIHETFAATTLAGWPNGAWTVQKDGTATGWTGVAAGEGLRVSDVQGGNGGAQVRFARAAWLPGEFRSEFRFRWQSAETDPKTNTAMQWVLLNLRDSAGNIVASQGYMDENIDNRGSPAGAVAIGPDFLTHFKKAVGQGLPVHPTNRTLAAQGTARVTIVRNGAGEIVTTFSDGVVEYEARGTSTATVAQVEIEIGRWVHPGATFEGITLERLEVNGGSPALDPAVRSAVRAAWLIPGDKRNEEQKKLILEQSPRITVTADAVMAMFPEYAEDVQRTTAAVQAETALKKTVVQLRGLQDLKDAGPESFVLRRGDFENRGRKVEAGVPAVFAKPDFKLQAVPGYKTTGRRKAFAEWLVAADHPTTARVHMNRVWGLHFGRGLVETVDDFGALGKRPSHPELLDWLATEFIARGWSQKAMHRLMLTSTAYRQSSALDPAKRAIDPSNDWLWAWRPQRHTGEVIRDSVLAVSGKLNRQMFGTPVAVHLQGDGSVIVADDGASNRRSVYLKVRRSQPVTLLDVFDTPRMEINCTRRTEATVPTQALAMLNSPFTESAAQGVASRVLKSASDRAGRVDAAWRLMFGRLPSATERESVDRFLDEYVQLQMGSRPAGSAAPTGAEIETAEAAGWPHVALMLLNANEFLYVD